MTNFYYTIVGDVKEKDIRKAERCLEMLHEMGCEIHKEGEDEVD